MYDKIPTDDIDLAEMLTNFRSEFDEVETRESKCQLQNIRGAKGQKRYS